jgi:putative flippase GtrA
MLNLLKNKIGIQFYKFIVVGVVATLVNYSIFYILLEFLKINYLISSAFGFLFGMVIGYFLNRKWTFQIEIKTTNAEIIKYFLVYTFSLILSLIFLKITVDAFKINAKIANFFALILTTFTNFIGIKITVFKD